MNCLVRILGLHLDFDNISIVVASLNPDDGGIPVINRLTDTESLDLLLLVGMCSWHHVRLDFKTYGEMIVTSTLLNSCFKVVILTLFQIDPLREHDSVVV